VSAPRGRPSSASGRARRHGGCRAAALASALLLARLLLPAARPASAEPVEPPPEAAEGADVDLELADSLQAGAVEMGIGATGRDGGAPTSRRRVRVHDGDLSAEARDGAGDPLAGGVIRNRRLTIGRFAPRWARGLVVGGADDPWRAAATGGGDLAVRHGRSLEGLALRARGAGAFELFGGRVARQLVAGVRTRIGPAGVGVIAAAREAPIASMAIERDASSTELAMDRAGRWRVETLFRRPLATATLTTRVRAGLAGLRAPVDPRRLGPAQALSMTLTRYQSRTRCQAVVALWRFRPGRSGARGALEVRRELAHHQHLSAGFEEQRGERRETSTAEAGVRQGLWGEWRGGPPGLVLELRGEAWGEGPWVRRAVRRASLAGVEIAGPAGATARVTHGVFRVRGGESLYLAEAESDRMVLRALTGAGERTRVEVTAPVADGRARAAVSVSAVAARPPRLVWTVDWTRRLSTRRPAR
jgi:hypothetical protein